MQFTFITIYKIQTLKVYTSKSACLLNGES